MKTRSEDKIKIIKKLYQTIEARKKLEKEEAQLKEEVKIIMGDEKVLESENFVVSLDERSRTDLDKKLMIESLGSEVLKKFEKTSSYLQMSVVKK